MMIVIIDIQDRIDAFLPQLDELVRESLVVLDEGEVVRYAVRDRGFGRAVNLPMVIVSAAVSQAIST